MRALFSIVEKNTERCSEKLFFLKFEFEEKHLNYSEFATIYFVLNSKIWTFLFSFLYDKTPLNFLFKNINQRQLYVYDF